MPARPEKVSGWPPMATPRREISDRPRVITAARVLSPGRVNPQSYDLQTYGADGRPGGEGENADIVSWK